MPLRWPLAAIALLALVLPAAARADTVALAPLATLGDESAAALRPVEAIVADGLRGVAGVSLIDPDAARRASARRRELRSCDGAPGCLAKLGELVGADRVVHGELGGLGDARVVYLELIDVGRATELRSTTLELGASDDVAAAALAAATRLLAPERYRGALRVEVDVEGASIFVDGERRGTSPAAALKLDVGSHALRVTHPEFHDFVRFVDVPFGTEERVRVDLQAYPIVDRELAATGAAALGGGARRGGGERPAPWYRRWYAVAGGAAVVFAASALTIGSLSGGIDADRIKLLP